MAKIASTRGMDGRATTDGEEAPDLSSSSSDDAATWSDDSDDDDSDDSENESESDDDGHDDDDVNDDDLVPVPWLAIRLPDVIGPRDGTYRLWRYQMWVQCVDILGPVVVSPDLATGGSRALSFAYAPDVAALVAKVARGECDARLGRSYNVACVERVSLQEIVEHVAECVRGDWGRKVGTRGGTRRREERRGGARARARAQARLGRLGGGDGSRVVGPDVVAPKDVARVLPLRGRGRDRPVEGDRGARFRADAAPGRGAGDGALVRGDVRGERGRRAQGTRRGCAAVEKKFRVEALLGGGQGAARQVATAGISGAQGSLGGRRRVSEV